MNGSGLGQLIDDISPGNAAEGAGPFALRDQQAAAEVADVGMLLPMMPALGTMVILFLLWRVVRVSGSPGRADTRCFRCPVLGRVVIAEFQLDPTDTRPIGVNWSTAFRPAAIVRCKRRCLKGRNGGHEQGVVTGVAVSSQASRAG